MAMCRNVVNDHAVTSVTMIKTVLISKNLIEGTVSLRTKSKIE